MAAVRLSHVFIACMAICLLPAEGRIRLEANYDADDLTDDMVDTQLLENDVHQVDEAFNFPADATDDIDPPPSDLVADPRLDDSFQGCMLGCINADLCCSCKASGRKSMVAAMVNQLTADCASPDFTDCAGKWVRKHLEANERGRASNCTRPDMVSSNVRQCASQCFGRPLSKPLRPKYPSHFPGRARDSEDVSYLPTVDLTDFCEDIRAEGFFCVSYRFDAYTAGRSMCRPKNRCGHHGYSYSWCWTSWSNHWDYCCTGSCGFGQGTSYEWCRSGNKWQYCGDAGKLDIKDRPCIYEYPCGVHQEIGKASYYWCYVDHQKNWDRCCQPWHRCGKHGESYDWCYTGYKRKSQWKHCVP